MPQSRRNNQITQRLTELYPNLEFNNQKFKGQKYDESYFYIVRDGKFLHKFYEVPLAADATAQFATERFVCYKFNHDGTHIACASEVNLVEITSDEHGVVRSCKRVSDLPVLDRPHTSFIIHVCIVHYTKGDVAACLKTLGFAARKNGVLHVITAVKHMHSKFLVHADIKTRNVFVAEDGSFFLGDFDLTSIWNPSQVLALSVSTDGYCPWPVVQKHPQTHRVHTDFRFMRRYDYFALFVFALEVISQNTFWAFNNTPHIAGFQSAVFGDNLSLIMDLFYDSRYSSPPTVDPKAIKKSARIIEDTVGFTVLRDHDLVRFKDLFGQLRAHLLTKTNIESDTFLDEMARIISDVPPNSGNTGYETLAEFAQLEGKQYFTLVNTRPGCRHVVNKPNTDSYYVVFETFADKREFELAALLLRVPQYVKTNEYIRFDGCTMITQHDERVKTWLEQAHKQGYAHGKMDRDVNFYDINGTLFTLDPLVRCKDYPDAATQDLNYLFSLKSL